MKQSYKKIFGLSFLAIFLVTLGFYVLGFMNKDALSLETPLPSQTDDGFDGPILEPRDEGGVDATGFGETQLQIGESPQLATLEQRLREDQQAAQQEAEELQRLHEEDRRSCQSKYGSGARPGGAIGEGVAESAGNVINNTVEEKLPENLINEAGHHLPEELITASQEKLPENLNQEIQEQLPSRVEDRLTETAEEGATFETTDSEPVEAWEVFEGGREPRSASWSELLAQAEEEEDFDGPVLVPTDDEEETGSDFDGPVLVPTTEEQATEIEEGEFAGLTIGPTQQTQIATREELENDLVEYFGSFEQVRQASSEEISQALDTMRRIEEADGPILIPFLQPTEEVEVRPGENLSEDVINQVVMSEIEALIRESLPQAMSQSMQDSLPQALRNSLTASLPTALENTLQDDLPHAFEHQLPDHLRGQLGGWSEDMLLQAMIESGMVEQGNLPMGDASIQSLIHAGGQLGLDMPAGALGVIIQTAGHLGMTPDMLLQEIRGIGGGGPFDGLFGDILPDIDIDLGLGRPDLDRKLEDMTEEFMFEISSIATEELNRSIDEISREMMGPFEEALDEVLATSDMFSESIDQMSRELTGAMDEIAFELSTGITEPLNRAVQEVTLGLDQSLNQITQEVTQGLTQSLNQMTREITQGLTQPLNQMTQEFTQSLTQPLNQIAQDLTQTITMPMAEITDAFTASITEPFQNITRDITQSITQPLTNIATDISQQITDPITGIFDNTIGRVTDSITNSMTQITDSIISPITDIPENIVGNFTDSVTGMVDQTISGVTDGVIGGVTQGALGGVGIPGLGGSVPVREVHGPLLSTTQSIDEHTQEIDVTTKNIEQLLVEICTYQKSIQRIQANIEQKLFVDDVERRREAASQVEQYRQDLLGQDGLIQTGYDPTGQGDQAPLFVQNLDEHLDHVAREQKSIFLDDLQEAGTQFGQMSNQVIGDDAPPGVPRSTITQEEYIKYVNGQLRNNPEEWQRVSIAIRDSGLANRPESASRLHHQELNSRQEKAIEKTKEEYYAYGGFLPVRECVEHTSDGTACRKWRNVTPASQVKESAAKAMDYRVDSYLNPEAGTVAQGNEPSAREVMEFAPSTSGGGGQAGGEVSGMDLGSILNLLSQGLNLFSRDHDQPSGTSSLKFDYSLPSIRAVLGEEQDNTGTISWQGDNLTDCRADNNWPGANISYGQELTENRLNFDLPVEFEAWLIRTRNGERHSLSDVEDTHSVDDKLLSTVARWDLNPETLQQGDELSLVFTKGNDTEEVSITVNDPSTALVELRDTAREKARQRESWFGQYTFRTQNNNLTVSSNLKYQIRCQGSDGNTLTDEVTVTRS